MEMISMNINENYPSTVHAYTRRIMEQETHIFVSMSLKTSIYIRNEKNWKKQHHWEWSREHTDNFSMCVVVAPYVAVKIFIYL